MPPTHLMCMQSLCFLPPPPLPAIALSPPLSPLSLSLSLSHTHTHNHIHTVIRAEHACTEKVTHIHIACLSVKRHNNSIKIICPEGSGPQPQYRVKETIQTGCPRSLTYPRHVCFLLHRLPVFGLWSISAVRMQPLGSDEVYNYIVYSHTDIFSSIPVSQHA